MYYQKVLPMEGERRETKSERDCVKEREMIESEGMQSNFARFPKPPSIFDKLKRAHKVSSNAIFAIYTRSSFFQRWNGKIIHVQDLIWGKIFGKRKPTIKQAKLDNNNNNEMIFLGALALVTTTSNFTSPNLVHCFLVVTIQYNAVKRTKMNREQRKSNEYKVQTSIQLNVRVSIGDICIQ